MEQNILRTSLTAEQANALLINAQKLIESKRAKFAAKWGPKFYAAMLSNIDVRENLTKEERTHLSCMAYCMAREYYMEVCE